MRFCAVALACTGLLFAQGPTYHLGTDVFGGIIALPPVNADPSGSCTNPAPPSGTSWAISPVLVTLSTASNTIWYCKGTTWTQAGGISGGPGSGGIGLLIDTGASGTAYAVNPAGCHQADLVHGFTFLFQPLHTSGVNASFTYCTSDGGGYTRAINLQNGNATTATSMIATSNATGPYPTLYLLTFVADPANSGNTGSPPTSSLNRFMLHENLRSASDAEAITGTAHGIAVDPSQVVALTAAYAPLGSVTLYKHQTTRNNGSVWLNSEALGRPSSGRTYAEWFANGTATLEARRMGAATVVAAGNCAAATASAISPTAPRLVNYATSGTTAGQYCIVSTPPASPGVAWGGSEVVFDATFKVSLTTNTNYFLGLVDIAHIDSSILTYSGGGANSPSALAGLRFSPRAGDTTSWRCTFAPDTAHAPQVADAGASLATVTTGIFHVQVRLVEGSGEYHFLVGAAGGNLTEVCMTGMVGGGNMPTGVALAPYIGEYIQTGGTAPTMSVADVGIESLAVPLVTLP